MRWVVGLLLVGAAILKAVQLIVEPATVLASPAARWLIPGQIAIELAVGLFALCGLYWHRLRALALALFIGFAAYSLSLAIGGATNCGCFGSLNVHPWWTFALDAAIVAGLLLAIWKEKCHSPSLARPRLAMALGTLSLSAALALGLYIAPQTSIASLPTVGDLVVLEPENWVGKPLPIADFIDLDLSTGEWIVVLHRHDCPKCQESVPKYVKLANEQRVALVEVPPFGTHAVSERFCEVVRLRDDREWFVQTPVELRLHDGVVVSASIDLPALASTMEP